jgi:hypothetical protein
MIYGSLSRRQLKIKYKLTFLVDMSDILFIIFPIMMFLYIETVDSEKSALHDTTAPFLNIGLAATWHWWQICGGSGIDFV